MLLSSLIYSIEYQVSS